MKLYKVEIVCKILREWNTKYTEYSVKRTQSLSPQAYRRSQKESDTWYKPCLNKIKTQGKDWEKTDILYLGFFPF